MSTTATATATAPVKGATMAAIRAALPQYFTLAPANVIKAMGDRAELPRMLALALTGAALERAQSGNTPALAGADSALETVKGKATRTRVDNALSHVRAIKARALATSTLDAYAAWADTMHAELSGLLAPAPVAAKPKTPATDWKARAMAAEAAHAAAIAHAETLAAMLAAHGVTAPALPVGATLAPANVTEDAPM